MPVKDDGHPRLEVVDKVLSEAAGLPNSEAAGHLAQHLLKDALQDAGHPRL